jgi:dihydrofolate synthase/folylpolyglutamate synthase
MLYQEALTYLYSLTDYERVALNTYSPATLNLDRMRDLLSALGNPHQQFKSIHIAGTKGKGSTAAMLYSCLRQLNQHVGLYTSPHLTSFRERIQVDGEMISREDLAKMVQRMKPVIDAHPGVTTFEAATALGFLYFAERLIDWAVVEVGLGGRLDATNVITPMVSVITSLSFDHTNWLGGTLPEIAAEKAGIIKQGVPVVSQAQPLEAITVLERIAHERNAPLVILGRHWRWTPGQTSLAKQTFQVKQVARVRSNENPFVNELEGWYEIPLLGKHQLDNATSVIATMDILRARDTSLEVLPRAIRDGLRLTHWPGRFEILRADPPIVADGAHNVDSVNKLAATLAEVFPGKRWVVVFGCYKDKDAEGMFKALSGRVTRWILTQVDNPRATPVERLVELAKAHSLHFIALPKVEDAMDAVIGSSEPACVTGSVALVGAARAVWAQRAKAFRPETDE